MLSKYDLWDLAQRKTEKVGGDRAVLGSSGPLLRTAINQGNIFLGNVCFGLKSCSQSHSIQ